MMCAGFIGNLVNCVADQFEVRCSLVETFGVADKQEPIRPQ